MNKLKKINNMVMCIVLILIVVVGFLLDNKLNYLLPKKILVDSSMRNDLKLYVFSAQVSISTLGIALIAILGGLFKESIYGVNILKYLSNDKPMIFKHKRSIIFQLILIIVSYILTALNCYYNLLISIFMVSIIINILMLTDIFYIYKGHRYLKNEIFNYIIKNFNEKMNSHMLRNFNKKVNSSRKYDLVIELKNDTLLNIVNGNISVIEDNLDLFLKMLEITSGCKSKEDCEILKLIEISLSDIFNKIFKDVHPDIIIMSLEKIDELYGICNTWNKLNVDKKYISIYDKIYYRFHKIIAKMFLEDIENKYAMINVLPNMYNNICFKDNNGKKYSINNIYLKYFSENIYYEMKNIGFEKYDTEVLHNIKSKLFTNIEKNLEKYKFDEFYIEKFDEYKDEKINDMYIQLYRYTKVLIDNNELKLLECLFFDKISIPKSNIDEQRLEYIFIIIIYIYYLIDTKSQQYVKEFILNNQESINRFLTFNYKFTFTVDNISKIREILIEEFLISKNEFVDDIIGRFILFFTLCGYENSDSIINNLSPIYELELISENSYKDKNYIKSLYIEFNNLFYGRKFTNEEVQKKFNILDRVQQNYIK